MSALGGPALATALSPMVGRTRSLLPELLAQRTRIAWLTIGLLLTVGTAIRFGQLFHSLNEQYAFRQTQTAFGVREFAEHGINLGTSPLPVFGAPWSVPMEFPLFQAIASFLVRFGVDSDVASRVTSLVFFQLTGVLLAILLLRWTNRLTTIVAMVCFEFTPFGIEWGAASLIEFFATFLILAMIIGVDLWFRKRSVLGLVLAGVAGPLAFAAKITTAVPWCVILLGLAIVLLRDRGWAAAWRRILAGYLAGPGLGFAVGVAWTRYSDVVKTDNPFTGFLTSSSLASWNFGTLTDRVSPTLHYIAFRVMDLMSGPLALTLVAAVVAIILTKRSRVELLSLVAVPFAAVAIFTNLYIQHEYYLAAVFPAIAALVAVGIVAGSSWIVAWLARTTATRRTPVAGWMSRAAVAAILTTAVLALTWVSPLGQSYAELFTRPAPVPAASTIIRENTAAGSQILMVGCSWDPTILYYAHRRGLTIQGAFPAGYDLSGYDYAYLCTPKTDLTSFLPSSMQPQEIAPELYRITT